ncbi:MAG: hypothetical protein HZB38_02905 [Planctomycetes bacterium]|nr:hypothetical protein [Planctomycetota bacterium]
MAVSPRNGKLRRELQLELLRTLNGAGRLEMTRQALAGSNALCERIEGRVGGESDFALPRAVYESTFFDASIESFINQRRIHRSEWNFVARLARELGQPVSHGLEKLDPPPAWMIDVDESHQLLRVWIRELALQDMLLAGLEAYLVPAGSGRPSTEIYGIVFGSFRVAGRRKRHTAFSVVDLNVERVCIQHRAQGSPSEVTADERSEVMQLDMAEELFPYWHLLGDFHTHTFKTLESVHAVNGWNYSPHDERVNVEWCEKLRALGHRPRVALILTIARAARQTADVQESWNGQPHVLRATIGKCHCFLAAFRIRPDGRYSTEGIALKCPHLAGQ